MYRSNGRTAEGIWVKGKQEGLFKLRVPKQGVFTCSFEDGLPAKDGKVESYIETKEIASVVLIPNRLSTIL